MGSARPRLSLEKAPTDWQGPKVGLLLWRVRLAELGWWRTVRCRIAAHHQAAVLIKTDLAADTGKYGGLPAHDARAAHVRPPLSRAMIGKTVVSGHGGLSGG